MAPNARLKTWKIGANREGVLPAALPPPVLLEAVELLEVELEAVGEGDPEAEGEADGADPPLTTTIEFVVIPLLETSEVPSLETAGVPAALPPSSLDGWGASHPRTSESVVIATRRNNHLLIPASSPVDRPG
jgi:hypothetical protein